MANGQLRPSGNQPALFDAKRARTAIARWPTVNCSRFADVAIGWPRSLSRSWSAGTGRWCRGCHQVLGDRHTAEDAFQATFLILARRAGSIRQPDLLGNWLHGVVADGAGGEDRDDRRRRRESDGNHPEGSIGKSPGPSWSCLPRGVEALHEEVARLPERYRIPVVLCDLEGLTQQEAADRLHCPPSTIGVRLMRARERLRTRLTGRGLARRPGCSATPVRGRTRLGAAVDLWSIVPSGPQWVSPRIRAQPADWSRPRSSPWR